MRTRIAELTAREERRFRDEHPRSRELAERVTPLAPRGRSDALDGEVARRLPALRRRGTGARFVDVDGHEYVDFCLGDTGAMTGHSPAPTVAAIARRRAHGITLMLPTEDAPWVGEELARRFGLPYWQFALTATDANRFAIRLARAVTGRPKVLVFNWCYHGTVDETFVDARDGRRSSLAPATSAPPVDPARHDARRRVQRRPRPSSASSPQATSPACWPSRRSRTSASSIPTRASTTALRELTRRTGTLLIIDETHTICAGPGRLTRRHGLEPDLLTIGKPIAGGVPAAAYGFAEEVAERVVDAHRGARTSTSAASAGRSPATRSRSPRCARRSSTC